MPLLQVRDFPHELYETISQVASAENRSVPQQTIVLLKNALNANQERKKRRETVLQEIDDFNIENANSLPDPTVLIREGRNR